MAIPTGPDAPLMLARMHAAELKQCLEQAELCLKLIRQIMVHRVVRHPTYTKPCTITKVSVSAGEVQIYGRIGTSRRVYHLTADFTKLALVEPEETS